LSVGAGTGLIYLLRWYWWRVNAWSEISDGVVVRGVDRLLRRAEVRRGDCRSGAAVGDGGRDDDRVGVGHAAHAAGGRRDAAAILRAHATRRPGMEPHPRRVPR